MELFVLSAKDTTFILKIRLLKKRSCNVINVVLEPPVELWNIGMQFGRAGK